MKLTRLILIPQTSGLPAPYRVINAEGVLVERGELSPGAGAPPEAMRTIAVTPGTDVLVRWLDLPPSGDVQARAAAAWTLRDHVAGSTDRLCTVLGPPPAPGEPRLVAVVSAALLAGWSDYLGELGVVADIMVPDVLTLPEPETEDALTAVAFGAEVALRGRRFAATVQPDLVDLVAAGRQVVAVEDPVQIERSLIEAARAPAINLLEVGAPRTVIGGWRRACVLAALVVVSPLILVLIAALRDDLAADRARAEAIEAIATLDPNLARAPDPVAELRQRLAAAPPPGGVSALAAALFTAVEGVEGAELDLLIADPGSGVKATITYPDYSNMEAIKQAMDGAGLTVTETATLAGAGRVVSDITIRAAR